MTIAAIEPTPAGGGRARTVDDGPLQMHVPVPSAPSPADFDTFAREQLPSLLRYATAVSGDPELGADLVQDVLLKAHRQWDRVHRAQRPDLYVRRMLINQHLSWRRRWHVRNVVPVADEVLHATSPPTGDDSQARADRKDLLDRLERLPRRQRVILVLRYFEDLDDAEIAELLQIAPGTVRSNVSRALALLRVDAAHPLEQP